MCHFNQLYTKPKMLKYEGRWELSYDPHYPYYDKDLIIDLYQRIARLNRRKDFGIDECGLYKPNTLLQ